MLCFSPQENWLIVAKRNPPAHEPSETAVFCLYNLCEQMQTEPATFTIAGDPLG